MGVLRRSFLVALGFIGLLITVAFVGLQGANAVQPGVSASPRLDVLQVVDGEVLDSAVIGDRVILVGTFTSVRNPGGNNINQPYIAAYSISTGNFDTGFRPVLDKPAYAVDTSGNRVFIGGNFTTVDGNDHRKIAKLTAAGNLISSFAPQASANVNDLAIANGKVYLAGKFKFIDGQPRLALAAVDEDTGVLDPATDFDFTFSVASGGSLSGKSLAITPDGSKLFISHTARFINGQERTAIARFNISSTSTSLASWQTDLYDDELDRFAGALRPRRLAMSPDGSYFVMVNSGGDRPPAGDTAVRFPVNGGSGVQADWVSRHFDTVLGVAISDEAVYVGGHFQFQEAPGSDDPFPGDKFTNYGFGFGEGPGQLGDQVVARQQLGSLDPLTGKSLEWNPGSNSFIGAQSLTFVPGEGLLVGHDGDRLGGVDIGRHAFFPIGNDDNPPPPDDDGFVCTVSADGAAAVLTFSGTRGTGEHLRRDNKWVANVTGLSTYRVAGGAGDDFSVRVSGDEFDNPYSEIDCGDGGNNNVTLDTSITAPTNATVVDPGNINLTGTASAPSGIKRVRIVVLRTVDTHFLNDDGSFTPTWAAVDIDMSTADETRSWAQTVNITQTGEYKLIVKTFANDGSKDPTPSSIKFTVGSTADDAPFLVVTGPTNPSLGNTAVIEGSATDDLGVQAVTFTIRERDLNLYLGPDGTLGTLHTFTANLSNPNGTSTNYIRTLTNVPVGDYQLRIEARDTSGQRFARTLSFAQVGNTAAPEIDFTSGEDAKANPGSSFSFAGTAQAEAGIDKIEVLVRKTLDWSGVEANGNLGPRSTYYVLPGTNGGTSRNWSYQSPNLPAGTYDVTVRVTDNLGARESATTQVIAGPNGDDLPTTTVTSSLRYQQGVNSLTIQLGGTAADDNGVDDVTIQVFDSIRREWLQVGGGADNIADPFYANLTSPGATSTTWNYTFTAPSAGTYFFHVRAVDDAGQASERIFASGRLYPGDAIPTVDVNSPSANQTITNQRIAVGGNADDDVSLAAIEVLFRHVDTGQYLRSDGSMGSAQWVQAALTNPGGDRTNFDYQTPVIATGTWVVTVRAKDNNGQTTVPTVRRTVTLN